MPGCSMPFVIRSIGPRYCCPSVTDAFATATPGCSRSVSRVAGSGRTATIIVSRDPETGSVKGIASWSEEKRGAEDAFSLLDAVPLSCSTFCRFVTVPHADWPARRPGQSPAGRFSHGPAGGTQDPVHVRRRRTITTEPRANNTATAGSGITTIISSKYAMQVLSAVVVARLSR